MHEFCIHWFSKAIIGLFPMHDICIVASNSTNTNIIWHAWIITKRMIPDNQFNIRSGKDLLHEPLRHHRIGLGEQGVVSGSYRATHKTNHKWLFTFQYSIAYDPLHKAEPQHLPTAFVHLTTFKEIWIFINFPFAPHEAELLLRTQECGVQGFGKLHGMQLC